MGFIPGLDIGLKELVIIILLVMFTSSVIAFFIDAYKVKKKTPPKLETTGIDYLEKAFKDKKKAAKNSKRKMHKRVVLTSDGWVTKISYRLWGMVYGRTCIDMIFKAGLLDEGVWVIIPAECVYDFHARNIRIDARSFNAWGFRIWLPTFSAKRPGQRPRLRNMVADHLLETLMGYGTEKSMNNQISGAATAGTTSDMEKWNALLSTYRAGGEPGDYYPEGVE